jgi:hypothetical protein
MERYFINRPNPYWFGFGQFGGWLPNRMGKAQKVCKNSWFGQIPNGMDMTSLQGQQYVPDPGFVFGSHFQENSQFFAPFV